MYGGHITDDWDRRLCKTYLEEYMNPQMVRQANDHDNLFSLRFLFNSLMVNFTLHPTFLFHRQRITKVIMVISMNFFHQNRRTYTVYILMLKSIFSPRPVKICSRRFWKCNHVMQVQAVVVKVPA